MFKKDYKAANDDIKPSEEFVSKVVKNATKAKPPLYRRYTKYAVAAAAAVVVVSGAVLSMPLWQSVRDSGDGIISEEKAVTDSSPAPSASDTVRSAPVIGENENNPPDTAKPVNSAKSNTNSKKGESGNNNGDKNKTVSSSQNTPQTSDNAHLAEESNTGEEKREISSAEKSDTATEETNRTVVAGETEIKARVYSAPEDMAPYGEQKVASAPQNSKKSDDVDIPSPSGYYCVSATPGGYTFQNDDGAVIEVTINYGGEERSPYIEEDGDNIYAVFTSYGMSVTINSRGAERASVEEIINQLR